VRAGHPPLTSYRRRSHWVDQHSPPRRACSRRLTTGKAPSGGLTRSSAARGLLRPELHRRPSHRRRLWLCLVDARARSSPRSSRRRHCCRRAERLHRSASAAALERLLARHSEPVARRSQHGRPEESSFFTPHAAHLRPLRCRFRRCCLPRRNAARRQARLAPTCRRRSAPLALAPRADARQTPVRELLQPCGRRAPAASPRRRS
jgi:hypothetical protein